MKVYLDNNIFAYLESGKLNLEDIQKLVPEKINAIFYSSAHIHETIEINSPNEHQRQEWINNRLEIIKTVTKNNYLFENLNNEVFYQFEDPFDVLETVSEVPFAKDMMKKMVNFITEEQKTQIRETLGLDSKELNNLSTKEIVKFLTKKIKEYGSEYSFLEFIEHSLSFHPESETMGLSNRIAAIFELLDIFGYWKDKFTEKSNYARTWDNSHTFYAAHCDIFISDDKRTRNKAKVVYEIYKVGTKVISSNAQS